MIEPLGDGALRVARPKGKDGRALLERVRAWPGVVDACLTEAWVGVYFAEGVPAKVDRDVLDALAHAPDEQAGSRVLDIAVRYDGADLEEVARLTGMSPRDVRAAHASAEYRVLFLGFMPGFAYLGGLPRELVVPRLDSPRVRVPKNAVAIAGPYAGVYPFASPGGWRLLGTAVDVDLFDAGAGALLGASDRVRFRDVT